MAINCSYFASAVNPVAVNHISRKSCFKSDDDFNCFEALPIIPEIVSLRLIGIVLKQILLDLVYLLTAQENPHHHL